LTQSSNGRDGCNKRGMMIFGLLILVFLVLSMASYIISGHMGIEERFNSAVGIYGETEKAKNSGIFGFNIEGNPLLYLIVFAALIAVCSLLYFKFKP
jgi:hypothetical protein